MTKTLRVLQLSRLSASLLLAMAVAAPAWGSTIDLRTQTDAVGETEVSFCARASPDAFGFPGHAFVIFTEKPVNQPISFRAVGHTVSSTGGVVSTVLSYFSGAAVSGKQAEERFTHMQQACLNVKVDRLKYEQALSAAKPTLTALGIPDHVAASIERYSLGANDCLSFIVRVASPLSAAGLNVPARAPLDTPLLFISKLTAQNGSL